MQGSSQEAVARRGRIPLIFGIFVAAVGIAITVATFRSTNQLYWPTISEAGAGRAYPVYAVSMCASAALLVCGLGFRALDLCRSRVSRVLVLVRIFAMGAGLSVQGAIPIDLEAEMDVHRRAAGVFFALALLNSAELNARAFRGAGAFSRVLGIFGLGAAFCAFGALLVKLNSAAASITRAARELGPEFATAAAFSQYALVGGLLVSLGGLL